MRISGFGVYRYSLPFTEPLTLKNATLGSREGLLLRLTGDDGSEGWGEAAPLPGFSSETLDEAAGQLLRVIGEMSRLGDRRPSGDRSAVLGLSVDPSVRFAVELALGALNAARRGVTVLEMLESAVVDCLPVSGLLSGSRDEVVGEAARMRATGYRSIKLKVGGRTVEEDALMVREVRETLGEHITLRLDANRAWSFEEAGEFARSTSDLRYEYVEEPLAEPERLAELAEKHGLPAALDESLVGMVPEDLEKHGYARSVVLKPTLLGGISRTLRLAEEAHRLGMASVVSSAYESGIGTLGLIALAAATDGAPAGLDTYRRLAGDVLVPTLDLDGPWIDARVLLGARREIAWDRLEPITEL